jgi:hypothetical protein
LLWQTIIYCVGVRIAINTCHVAKDRTRITPSEPPKAIHGPSAVVDERPRNYMLVIEKDSNIFLLELIITFSTFSIQCRYGAMLCSNAESI